MNPWYSKIFETSHWHLMLDGTSLLLYLSIYADAFFVLPFDLCIIVLKNESFSFLILRHLGPTVLSNFFRALIHSRISHGKPQRILEYEETYIRVYICVYIYIHIEGMRWGFNIVRTFQSVYDYIDSSTWACRHLAEVSNHLV